MTAAEWVIRRDVDAVRGALARVQLPGAAYSVGLWASDQHTELDPAVICVGLDADRERAIRDQVPYEAFLRVWNVADFALDYRPVPDPLDDPRYVSAAKEVADSLAADGVDDPKRHVLNRAARELTALAPLEPVTSDFVVFMFDEDFSDALLSNLRYSATDRVAAQLRAKGLLPEKVQQLGGFKEGL